MTATYELRTDLRLKYVHIAGETHLRELRDIASLYAKDPLFSVQNRFVVDLLDLGQARAGFRDVFALKAIYETHFKDIEEPVDVAIVTSSVLGHGISRIFATLMAAEKIMRVRIFKTFDEAAVFLNLPAEELHALRNNYKTISSLS
jgi:hypothetical protein